MGISFVDLAPFAQPGVDELKTTLEFVHEWGTSRVFPKDRKPGVTIFAQLQSFPNYFGQLVSSRMNENRKYLTISYSF